jgi:OFA family oxalate/formate antiporter-like MFS transporter
VVSLLAQLLRNPPANFQVPARAAGAPARAAAVARNEAGWSTMLRTPQFYQLWILYVLAASAGLMIIANVPIIAKEQAAWEAGFVPVMLLAIFNTLGRFGSGALSDRIGRTNTMVIAFALQAVNMLLFIHYRTPLAVAAGAAFTGLCYGTIFTLMPAATADFYGLRNLGVNYGLVFTGFGVAGVLGSLLGGRIRDLFGSYGMAYTICAVMLAVAAVLAFATRPPRQPAQ